MQEAVHVVVLVKVHIDAVRGDLSDGAEYDLSAVGQFGGFHESTPLAGYL